MMTVCAGRLTPHANVAVDTSTCMWPSAKRSSTSVRSARVIPALWIAKPYGNKSCNSLFFVVSASVVKISRDAESSRKKSTNVSFISAVSRIAFAVFPHSFLECTNTMIWFLPA